VEVQVPAITETFGTSPASEGPAVHIWPWTWSRLRWLSWLKREKIYEQIIYETIEKKAMIRY